MNKEKIEVKQQLEEELQQIKFTKHTEVLKRTHPVSVKQKLSAIWNKEIEIPIVPVGAMLALLLFSWGILNINNEQQMTTSEKREIVEVAGNMYWKDDLEKVVAFDED